MLRNGWSYLIQETGYPSRLGLSQIEGTSSVSLSWVDLRGARNNSFEISSRE